LLILRVNSLMFLPIQYQIECLPLGLHTSCGKSKPLILRGQYDELNSPDR
jgi:hypothetical protein